MAKLVFISTFGADDVERASLPFALATASLASGHEVHMYLQGPAVELLDGVQIVGGAAMVEQCLTADKVFTYA